MVHCLRPNPSSTQVPLHQKIEDDDMIAHILNNLPADNEHLRASLRPNVASLTLAQVRTQVREFYKDRTK